MTNSPPDQLAMNIVEKFWAATKVEPKVTEAEDPLAPLCFTWKEKFNAHKLKYVVDHLEELKAKIIAVGHDFKGNDKKWGNLHKQLTNYMNASKNGVIEVKYHQTAPRFGRMFANRSMSLQNITRAVRHTIAGDLYWDIDIVNAHVVILAFICKQKGIKTECLGLYNNNRDQVLAAIMKDSGMSRGDVKQLFLAVMNGGQSDFNKLPTGSIGATIVGGFKTECERIWDTLIALDPDRYEGCKAARIKSGKDYNHKGSFANKLLCDMENKILAVMVNFFKTAGLITDTCVLCFDGVMIYQNGQPRPKFDILLPECSAAIKKALGIDIALAEKPMLEGLELPKDIGEYIEPRLEYFADHNQFAAKEVTVAKLSEWINKALVYITGGGNGSMYTKNIKIDPKNKQPIVYFEGVGTAALMDALSINVNIINPDHDPDAYKEIEKLETDGKKVPKALKAKAAQSAKYLDIRTLDKFIQLQRANRTMVVKNSIDFYPYLKRNHPDGLDIGDTFNVFTGFPLDGIPFEKPQTFEQSKLYAHLRDEMFPGDVGELNHFLDFVADMVQRPAQLRACGHLFYTRQGCGKGMIVEWIKKLLGQDHVVVFNSTNAYFQKFNADRMNKILNVLEELSERGECFNNHNQLKADMASETIRIEWKGGAIAHMRHFARYIFNTNNDNALNVEHDDRRLTMHRGTSQHANDREYFIPLWAEVNSPDFALMCFNYMAERKYDEASVMRPYATAYKQEQQAKNMSNVISFIIDCIETKWVGLGANREGIRVGSDALYEKYKSWASANTLKCYSNKKFMPDMALMGIGAPKSLLLLGEKRRCFEIDDNLVLAALRLHLKNPSLAFDIPADE